MTPDVSVQVCTFNRRDSVARCLAALASTSFDPSRFEIVLVDDGSTDETETAVRALGLPNLVYVRQSHAGLASARNAGIRAARGRVVLFVDDDTLADANLLNEHWRTHTTHPRAVVMGAVRHVATPATPAGRPRLADLSTSFFWTSNASVHRADLFAAGLFDEDFTEYGWEDLELGDRLRAMGLVRRRNSRAVVRHVKPQLAQEDLGAMLRRAEASGRTAVVYLRKRPSLRTRLATGVTPVRRTVFRAVRALERPLLGLVERAPNGPLRGVPRVAAEALAGIHYYRSIERTLAPARE